MTQTQISAIVTAMACAVSFLNLWMHTRVVAARPDAGLPIYPRHQTALAGLSTVMAVMTALMAAMGR